MGILLQKEKKNAKTIQFPRKEVGGRGHCSTIIPVRERKGESSGTRDSGGDYKRKGQRRSYPISTEINVEEGKKTDRESASRVEIGSSPGRSR